MSYASIMVQADMTGELGGRVCVAGQLADRFQSHLIGISSWMPRPPLTAEGVVIDPVLWAEELAKRDELLNQRGHAFKAAVEIDAGRVEWRSSQEFPNEYIAREARAADLVIVSSGRPVSDPYVSPDPGELLLHVGRPVLTVPPGISSMRGQRVVVAWKDTREARRAIQDALPFLHRADEVVIAEVCEHADDIARCQTRLRDVAAYLARHRIVAAAAVRLKPRDETAGSSLLRLVEDELADLIVAGAYGHWRIGQLLFGGMTQSLLADSPVCCLFSH